MPEFSRMTEFAVFSITVLMNAVLLYTLMYVFVDESYKPDKKRVFIVWGICLAVLTAVYLLDLVVYAKTCIVEAVMVIGVSYKKGKGTGGNLKRFMTVFMINEIIGLNMKDFIALMFYSVKEDTYLSQIEDSSGWLTVQCISFIGVFLVISSYLYLFFIKKGILMKLRRMDTLFLFKDFLFAMTVFIFLYIIDMQDVKISGGYAWVRICLSMLIALLIVSMPITMLRARVSAYYKELSDYQQTFLETELNASRQYKAAQEDTRAFRHDVQNNLAAVVMLMDQGKTEEARQYLNDMLTEVAALSPKVVTGDDMLDSLVSSKLAKMEEQGIRFKLDGVIDGGLDWKPMDICTVFANMLDNAVEAAVQTDDPFIELSFKKTDHHRLVRAVNSCKGEVDCEKLMSDEAHMTSKENVSIHGYGIKNIRRTIDKYGGMMRLSCADNTFTMELILQKD